MSQSPPEQPILRYRLRRVARVVLWTLTALYIAFACLVLATRWFILPNITQYKPQIAAELSAISGAQVSIEQLEPQWDGVWPRITLRNISITKPDRAPAQTHHLLIPELRASFYWRSILGTIALRTLDVTGLRLSIHRHSATQFEIAGLNFDLQDLAGETKGQKTDILAHLIHHGNINLLDSAISYHDHTGALHESIFLRDLNITVKRRLLSWHFGLQGSLRYSGEKQTSPVDIRGKIRSMMRQPSLNLRDWNAQLYFDLPKLDMRRLFRSTPIESFVRSGDTVGRGWITITRGYPEKFLLETAARNVDLAVNDKPVFIKSFSGRLSGGYADGRLQILADHVSMQNDTRRGISDFSGDLSLGLNDLYDWSVKPRSMDLSMPLVDLEKITDIALQLPLPKEMSNALSQIRPTGTVENIVASYSGENWQVDADLRAIHSKPIAPDLKRYPERVGIPGVRNLSGHLSASQAGAKLTLDMQNGSVTVPNLLAAPTIPLTMAKGDVSIGPDGSDDFRVSFQDIEASNAHAHVTTSGYWTSKGGSAGTLNLEGNVIKAHARNTWRYLPLILDKDVRSWLEGGIRGGVGEGGKVVIRGPLHRFPWDGPKDEGKFYVGVPIRGAVIDYLPSMLRDAKGDLISGKTWPLLTHLNAMLEFDGAQMRVSGTAAKTVGLTLSGIRAVIPDLSAGDGTRLTIDGQVQGTLQNMLSFVNASPIGAMLGNAFQGGKATGNAGLGLHLSIPLTHANDTNVVGDLQLERNSLTLKMPYIPPAKDIKGSLRFTEKGLETGSLTASMFGENVTVDIPQPGDALAKIQARGTFDIRNLRFFDSGQMLEEVLRHVHGKAPVQTLVTIDAKSVDVDVKTDLAGVQIGYPAPLAKQPRQPQSTRFHLASGFDAKIPTVMNLSLGDRLNIDARLPAGKTDLALAFGIGQKVTRPNSGIRVFVKAGDLDIDQWRDPVIDAIAACVQQYSTKGTAAQSDIVVRANVAAPSAFGHVLGPTQVIARPMGQNLWKFDFSGKSLQGEILWNSTRGPLDSFRLNLQHAIVDQAKHSDSSEKSRFTGTTFPGFSGTIGSLTYKGMHLGRVRIDSEGTLATRRNLWRLNDLTIENPECKVQASGQWRLGAQSETHATLNMHLSDGGKTLARLGYPHVLEATHGSGTANLTWRDVPWSPHWASLSGSVSTELHKGTLLQADTGVAAKLVSFLSFQSLLKRLQLDFKDIVSSGLVFDTLSSSMKATNGVFSTDSTKIIGTQATVLLTGKADLNTEALDFNIMAIPDINASGAAVALTVVNPAIGIGALIAQLVLQNPINRLLAKTYHVKGTLSNPVFDSLQAKDLDQSRDSK